MHVNRTRQKPQSGSIVAGKNTLQSYTLDKHGNKQSVLQIFQSIAWLWKNIPIELERSSLKISYLLQPHVSFITYLQRRKIINANIWSLRATNRIPKSALGAEAAHASSSVCHTVAEDILTCVCLAIIILTHVKLLDMVELPTLFLCCWKMRSISWSDITALVEPWVTVSWSFGRGVGL